MARIDYYDLETARNDLPLIHIFCRK